MQGSIATAASTMARAISRRNSLTLRLRRSRSWLGLRPPITLHSLRHTHASTLIASGLDVLSISRRLGHASPVLTLGTYGHLFKPDDRAAAIMEKALITARAPDAD
jgi:integrase